MTRFFVEEQELSGDTLFLRGENFQHAKVPVSYTHLRAHET